MIESPDAWPARRASASARHVTESVSVPRLSGEPVTTALAKGRQQLRATTPEAMSFSRHPSKRIPRLDHQGLQLGVGSAPDIDHELE